MQPHGSAKVGSKCPERVSAQSLHPDSRGPASAASRLWVEGKRGHRAALSLNQLPDVTMEPLPGKERWSARSAALSPPLCHTFSLLTLAPSVLKVSFIQKPCSGLVLPRSGSRCDLASYCPPPSPSPPAANHTGFRSTCSPGRTHASKPLPLLVPSPLLMLFSLTSFEALGTVGSATCRHPVVLGLLVSFTYRFLAVHCSSALVFLFPHRIPGF